MFKCLKGLAAAAAPRANAADGPRSEAGLGPPGEHPEPWPGAEGWFQSLTPSKRLSQGRRSPREERGSAPSLAAWSRRPSAGELREAFVPKEAVQDARDTPLGALLPPSEAAWLPKERLQHPGVLPRPRPLRGLIKIAPGPLPGARAKPEPSVRRPCCKVIPSGARKPSPCGLCKRNASASGACSPSTTIPGLCSPIPTSPLQ